MHVSPLLSVTTTIASTDDAARAARIYAAISLAWPDDAPPAVIPAEKPARAARTPRNTPDPVEAYNALAAASGAAPVPVVVPPVAVEPAAPAPAPVAVEPPVVAPPPPTPPPPAAVTAPALPLDREATLTALRAKMGAAGVIPFREMLERHKVAKLSDLTTEQMAAELAK